MALFMIVLVGALFLINHFWASKLGSRKRSAPAGSVRRVASPRKR
jgi:hypothetical protein